MSRGEGDYDQLFGRFLGASCLVMLAAVALQYLLAPTAPWGPIELAGMLVVVCLWAVFAVMRWDRSE